MACEGPSYAHLGEARMFPQSPGQQRAELPPELAAHPHDSAPYEDWKAWRHRRREWFIGNGLTYAFLEDLRLRQFVRQSGGTWLQPEPGLSAWVPPHG
jgi:hypothetical protein